MSADQFFYVMFSTFTNREVFGLLTYYYSEVLLYSAIFGSSMLATSSFTVNNCMMYRDAVLVILALLIHMVYVYTLNQTVVWGSFGLYIVYVIMDWKNDSLTHIGMKLLGKIKDDDSFEGYFPMQIKPKRIEVSDDHFDEIEEIIEDHQAQFDRNMKCFEIYAILNLIKEARHKFPPHIVESKELFNHPIPLVDGNDFDLHKSIRIRVRFAKCVYKLIFYLRSLIQKGIEARQNSYLRNSEFPGLTVSPGGFPMDMNPREFDIDQFDDQKSMKSAGDDDNMSSSPRKQANSCNF